jgi:hypothetical protein
LSGGLEFLELCGFEKTKEGEFLYLPRDKVDMAALNTTGYELKSAMTNPFFGVLSRQEKIVTLLNITLILHMCNKIIENVFKFNPIMFLPCKFN